MVNNDYLTLRLFKKRALCFSSFPVYNENMAKRISIIILNWNGLADTKECLASLAKATSPRFDVVVVDNASKNQDAVVYALRREFPKVEVIALPENRGFAGGNNVGIEWAKKRKSDYMLLLNNDTMVAPDFLKQLVDTVESDKTIGIVGPKIYYHSDSKKVWYNGAAFSWLDGGKHFTGDRNEIHETSFATGCALLIKREVIEKIGLMPEEYFLYYEDVDWSFRAHKAGFRLMVAPKSHVWHKVSSSTSKLGEPVRHYYHIRNALLLASRHAPILTKVGVYAWSLWYYTKQVVKLMLLPSKRAVSRAIMRGIADFWKGKIGYKNPSSL